jgi:hypothetical protein
MKLASVAILLALSLQACERKVALNEAAIRSWASSSEVVSRDRPSLYTDNGTGGSYLAVAAGNFKETPDGIDLESMTPLQEGFYVFPGKIKVRTIDEAIRTMKKIEPGRINPKAEQAGRGDGDKPSN